MLAYLVYPTTATTALPLRPDRRKTPRLQFVDTGLLNYDSGLQPAYYQHDSLHTFYRGG